MFQNNKKKFENNLKFQKILHKFNRMMKISQLIYQNDSKFQQKDIYLHDNLQN